LTAYFRQFSENSVVHIAVALLISLINPDSEQNQKSCWRLPDFSVPP
jgi:hypothetical protein